MTPERFDTILVAARTDKGLREENQDAMTSFLSPFGSVYLVADGMGGRQGGALASAMTADCYRKYLTSLEASLPSRVALERATAATNAEIRLRSQSGEEAVAGMGSTVVMVLFAATEAGLAGTVAHIGDSRAYLLRQGTLSRLTRDHSAVQRLIDSRQITPDEARNHPDATMITRALGPQDEVEIEVLEERFAAGDILLLCSDGLCGYVGDAAIAAELAIDRDLAATADALIALSLRSGSGDNITVQVLKVEPAAHPTTRLEAVPVRGTRLSEPAAEPDAPASIASAPTPIAAEPYAPPKPNWLVALATHAAVLIAGILIGIYLPAPVRALLPHTADASQTQPGAATTPSITLAPPTPAAQPPAPSQNPHPHAAPVSR